MIERVSQDCEKFGLSERSLQRLTARRIGLSPKWLIQRRRLHEAAGLLAAGATPTWPRSRPGSATPSRPTSRGTSAR